jgi:hypothetical protein
MSDFRRPGSRAPDRGKTDERGHPALYRHRQGDQRPGSDRRITVPVDLVGNLFDARERHGLPRQELLERPGQTIAEEQAHIDRFHRWYGPDDGTSERSLRSESNESRSIDLHRIARQFQPPANDVVNLLGGNVDELAR